MSQFRVEMVVDFFGLILLSLSVCLPDVFLDGSNLRLINGLFGDLCYYQSSKRPVKHGSACVCLWVRVLF